MTDNRWHNRVADGGGLQLLGALEDVDRDFQVGMLEADWLGPLLAGGLSISVAKLLRRLASEAGLERMMLGPPDLGRQARGAFAQRLYGRGNSKALAGVTTLGRYDCCAHWVQKTPNSGGVKTPHRISQLAFFN